MKRDTIYHISITLMVVGVIIFLALAVKIFWIDRHHHERSRIVITWDRHSQIDKIQSIWIMDIEQKMQRIQKELEEAEDLRAYIERLNQPPESPSNIRPW